MVLGQAKKSSHIACRLTKVVDPHSGLKTLLCLVMGNEKDPSILYQHVEWQACALEFLCKVYHRPAKMSAVIRALQFWLANIMAARH